MKAERDLRAATSRALRVFVFDLDDTLSLESDYIRSGFLHVAAIVAETSAYTQAEVFSFLWTCFENGVTGNTFDLLLKEYPEIADHRTVPQLVNEYRNHKPALSLLGGVEAMLGSLRSTGAHLALVTDGPAASQRAKYQQLGLDRYTEIAVFTDEKGTEFRKPHLWAFETVQSRFSFPPDQFVYIGDNPEKDFAAPRQLGWHTVRVRMPAQRRHAQEAHSPEYAPDLELVSIPELHEYLLRCASSAATAPRLD